MKPRMLIIADDLTGAADCGAACGGNTVVLLDKSDCLVEDAAIVAVDADTRSMASDQAAETVGALVSDMIDSYDSRVGGKAILLFKKLDSTLRGHVAAELAAALEARRCHALRSERIVVLFAPAFPAHGRTTVQGRQMVGGQLLENLDSWPDGRFPARSNIAEILGESGLSSALIELVLIRAGAQAVEEAMIRLANEVDVIVCDAETEADLDAIANAGMALHPGTVWAGAAGLARYVPNAAGFLRDAGSASQPEHRRISVSGPTLTVVGSPANASQEQARVLAAAAGLHTISVSASALANESVQCENARLISEKLERGADVLVQLDSAGSCTSEGAQLVTRSLARMIEPCSSHVGALVATGGETARAILDAWGIRRLRLLGEVEPGLPYSATEGWNRTLPVLTKAGAFGTPGTLMHCRDFLQALVRDPLR